MPDQPRVDHYHQRLTQENLRRLELFDQQQQQQHPAPAKPTPTPSGAPP